MSSTKEATSTEPNYNLIQTHFKEQYPMETETKMTN